MFIKEFVQLTARPADLRHHDLHPRRAAPAVRLRHQHHAAPSADRRARARGQRPRPLDPGRAQQHLLLPRHARWPARKPRWTTGCARATCCSASRSPRASSAACGAATVPALLVAADASDPVAAGTALGALEGVVRTALARDRGLPETIAEPAAFEIRQHRRYNPAAVTSLNIVPGLLGTILTMTMLIFTALSVTREVERGTMESLLAMPIKPLEIMLGKIAPYIVIGFLQAALIMRVRRDCSSPCRSPAASRCWRRFDAVHRHQPVDRLHLLHDRPEPAAGDPDVLHVLPAQHPAVGVHVPVRRHAGLGAVDRRDAAAHPLHPHRARHHAEGRRPLRPAVRGAGAASA